MAKVGGFLEYGRAEPGYRDPKDRVHDYRQVEKNLEGAELTKQAARCMECGTPFCHTSGCPLGNIIPEFNDLTYANRMDEAFRVLQSTCNFPEFTGRLCPAPCEASCVLGINDSPVTIRHVELAIIENAFAKGIIKARIPQRNGKRVAVVGSGPAGLAVADRVNQSGTDVVVFESAKKAGGLIRYGIPDFKMEKHVVDRRLDLMEEEGIRFQTGTTIGTDITFDQLREEFDAIALTGGARQPRDLPIEGRQLHGVHFAMEFLTSQNKKNSGEPLGNTPDISAAGKVVVVIGGGDTGSDCVGTSIRHGAKLVNQFEILPKPPPGRADNTPWPLWPNMLRESSSQKEGCQRRWSINTKAFLGRDGKLTGMRCVEIDMVKGADGRMNMVERPGTEFEIEVQVALLAMGFVGPGPNKLVADLGILFDKRGNIQVDDHCMTSVPGIFAGGDMATGQSLIVRAMAHGRRTADGIIHYLGSGASLRQPSLAHA